MEFQPDYTAIERAARNIGAQRVPLYEHIICPAIMENILGIEFRELAGGDFADKKEYFRNCCRFFAKMGYDTVSFEQCIGPVMPGSGALGGHKPGVMRDRADFEAYPWAGIPDAFFAAYSEDFAALREVLPAGMRAIGGPGNGVFECVQDITGYMDLCYIAADDPDLYAELFAAVGRTNLAIWDRFMREFGDIYCVLRFGDDLGFKSNTLISVDDIRSLVIPAYRPIIDLVHSYGKPFLLHSCGSIFEVMDDLIAAGIDAKHSNEDQIAPFPVWVEKYGDRIGNFGGADTDFICRNSPADIREYVRDVMARSVGHGGFAFGSGNSIPDYVPVEGYLAMVRAV
ncbi:MAG: uroporphyrinogen decarboxylase family protein, partial [Rectinemataceae bacterium]|nr:uroporphyrinogen decarboxylase family protein [Rectinemataceae bacterium]